MLPMTEKRELYICAAAAAAHGGSVFGEPPHGLKKKLTGYVANMCFSVN